MTGPRRPYSSFFLITDGIAEETGLIGEMRKAGGWDFRLHLYFHVEYLTVLCVGQGRVLGRLLACCCLARAHVILTTANRP